MHWVPFVSGSGRKCGFLCSRILESNVKKDRFQRTTDYNEQLLLYLNTSVLTASEVQNVQLLGGMEEELDGGRGRRNVEPVQNCYIYKRRRHFERSLRTVLIQ